MGHYFQGIYIQTRSLQELSSKYLGFLFETPLDPLLYILSYTYCTNSISANSNIKYWASVTRSAIKYSITSDKKNGEIFGCLAH